MATNLLLFSSISISISPFLCAIMLLIVLRVSASLRVDSFSFHFFYCCSTRAIRFQLSPSRSVYIPCRIIVMRLIDKTKQGCKAIGKFFPEQEKNVSCMVEQRNLMPYGAVRLCVIQKWLLMYFWLFYRQCGSNYDMNSFSVRFLSKTKSKAHNTKQKQFSNRLFV